MIQARSTEMQAVGFTLVRPCPCPCPCTNPALATPLARSPIMLSHTQRSAGEAPAGRHISEEGGQHLGVSDPGETAPGRACTGASEQGRA